jgi:hypothetical protein
VLAAPSLAKGQRYFIWGTLGAIALGCATTRPFDESPPAAGAAGRAGTAGALGAGHGGRTGSSAGGAAGEQGGEGGAPNQARTCDEGSFRCQANVPEQCKDGVWEALTPCSGAASVCIAATGECARAPKSAVGIVSGAAVVSGGAFRAEVQLGTGIAPTWASGGRYRLYGSAVIDSSAEK